MGKIEKICSKIEEQLKAIPVEWDGKKAIRKMKKIGDGQWKQMEWIGFYFQFLCEKYLKGLFEFQIPRYGNASFDGLYKIPFDFKAHAIGKKSHIVLLNDREAIECGINDYGSVGLIVAEGVAIYDDEDRTFYKWHEALKGEVSAYTLENRKKDARSRRRKISMTLKRILIIEITEKTLHNCKPFQKGFKNSDGNPRREKLKINLEKHDKMIKHCIEYS